MNRLTSRKFILSLLTLASATWLCWFGHIGDGLWRDVVIATVGVYIAGNVMQKKVTNDPA